MVLIGWSSVYRFRLVISENLWKVFMPNYDINAGLNPYISEKTVQEILINRNSHLYIEELNSIILLINSIPKNYNLFQWTHCNDGKLNATLIAHCERIREETNDELMDGYKNDDDYVLNDELMESSANVPTEEIQFSLNEKQ